MRGPRTIVGHNVYAFDCLALEQDGVSFDYDHVEDTLLAHHAYASHLPQRMDQAVSVYLDSGPWKVKAGRRGAEEKGLAPHLMDADDLCRYNAEDCRLEASLWQAMQSDIDGERKVYEHDKKLALLCQGMSRAGVRVDLERQAELRKLLRNRAGGLLGEMRKLVGRRAFHPMRAKDLRKALYGQFRLPMLLPTPTGLPATSKFVLQGIRYQDTRAGHLADLVLRYRSAMKAKSTYVDGLEVLSDERVHASWKAFGTVSGRLSCRLQQFPRMKLTRAASRMLSKASKEERDGILHDPESYELETRIRELIIPAEGYEFVYFDVAQAEMKLAAQLSGDENFIRVCAQKDVHAANACLIWPDLAEMILADPKGKGAFYRSVAKNTGFAVNYLAGEETLHARINAENLAVPVSMKQVRAMLSMLHKEFKVHFKYIDNNVRFVQQNGFMRTPFGRIRWFGVSPPPTEIANFPVQGGVADIVNERLIRLNPRLPSSCPMVMQIHDAAIFECPKGEPANTTEKLIREVWDEDVVLPTNGRRFKLPIDLKRAERLSDLG